MSLEPILVLIVIAVVANLVIMALLVASPAIGRGRDGGNSGENHGNGRSERAMAAAAVVGRGDDSVGPDDEATARTYDRVVRIA